MGKYKPLGLDSYMPFGKHKLKTVKEVIDTQGSNSINWYLENTEITLDKEAYDYFLEGIEAYFQTII